MVHWLLQVQGVCGPIVTFLTSFGTLVGIGGSINDGKSEWEKKIIKKAEQVLANSFSGAQYFFCSADYQFSSSKR